MNGTSFDAPSVGRILSKWLAGLAALAIVTTAAAQAQTTMYANATTPLLASAGGTAQGTVTPGTAVTVLDTSGADSHVQLEGWSMQGSDTVVFKGVGERIVLLVLNGDAKADRKAGESKKDDYGSSWQQVTVTGWVATKDLASSADAVWKAGQQVYDTRCSACHSLHAPTEFTANQWPGILKAMGKNASLDQADLDLVTRYLQAHAKGQ